MVKIEIPVHPEVDKRMHGKWKMVDVPHDILRALQEQNRAHFFGQAKGTPITIQQLSEQLGYCRSNSDSTDQILNGQYDTSNLPQQVLRN